MESVTSRCETQPGVRGVLNAAAALLAAAGDTGRVVFTIDDTTINVQVSHYISATTAAREATTREAVVAVYAHALSATVTRRPSPAGRGGWCETRGHVNGHPVHVWTFIDDEEA